MSEASDMQRAAETISEAARSIVVQLDRCYGPAWLYAIDELTAELKRFNDAKEKEQR